MSNKIFYTIFFASIFCLIGCTQAQTANTDSLVKNSNTKLNSNIKEVSKIQNSAKVIHVLVALCDNENQGIVPVPKFLGDGEDPAKNLYWGAAYGVKTFFTKSRSWQNIAEFENPKATVLQRIIFKHKTKNIYLVADAYRGSRMRETIADFFSAVSGEKLENIKLDSENLTLQILGSANLVAFVGHNGLMDFDLKNQPSKKDDAKREAIILACASRNYFADPLKKTSATPLLWTSNLMAPEAYILHDALEGWAADETDEQIRTRAATAYSRYQKISLKSARNLLVTGW